MKKISFFLLIIIISCQKETDNINIARDKIVGDYCGEITESGGRSPFNTTVRKSETSSDKIIFDDFVGGDNVEAIIKGCNLVIPEKTYRNEEMTSAGPSGELYYYDLTVSGNGTLDTCKHFIRINLTLKETYKGQERVSQSTIEMFNSSKYSYTGTFTEDSTTVIISRYNDSLLVSIAFQEDWIPYGWDSIKASESYCYISISVDSIKDISSGEMYRVVGSAHKLGNGLKFSLFAYYHGISPLYIYDFTVIKAF
jgi:hypothetical protein